MVALGLAVLFSALAQGQADFEKGYQAYQSYHSSDFDTVSLANGGLVLNIPLLSYEQRGSLPPVVITIRSNSTTFQSNPPIPNGPGTTRHYEVPSGVVGSPWGTPYVMISPGGLTWKEERIKLQKAVVSRFVAIDDSGASHSLGGNIFNSAAPYIGDIRYSIDGSDLMLTSEGSPRIVDRHGNIGGLIDPNGNAITLRGRCAKPAGTGQFFNPALAPWEGYAQGTASAMYIVDSIGRVIPNPSYVQPIADYSCIVDTTKSYYPADPQPNPYCLSNEVGETYQFPAQYGSTIPLTFCYEKIGVHLALPTASRDTMTVNETWPVLTAAVLPNGTSWRFAYDTWGQVSSVTLPTGAQVSYTYNGGDVQGTRLACGNPPGEIPTPGLPWWPFSNLMSSRMVTERTLTVTTPDGTNSTQSWSYASTIGSGWAGTTNSGQVTVTDPLDNDTVHTFSLIGQAPDGQAICGPYETAVKHYQGSSTSGNSILLKEVDTAYTSAGADHANPTNFSNYIAIGVLPISVTTKLFPATGNPQVRQDTFTHDLFGTYQDYKGSTYRFSMGQRLAQSESDWATGSPGPILRTSQSTNLWQGNWRYYAANLIDLPCLTTVFTGTQAGTQSTCIAGTPQSNQASQTSYAYDESAYGPSGARGNLTSLTSWLNTGGASPVSHTFYNTYGMPIQKVAPLGNATLISYDSSGLYPNQITHPQTGTVAHIEVPTYDDNTGLLLSHRDENQNTTAFSYDGMRRLTQTSYPDGGLETITYTDTTPPSFAFTQAINSSTTLSETGLADSLGRKSQTRLTSDPSGTTYTLVTYDALGRASQVYNPTRCWPISTNCGESTWGFTTYRYDALGRPTSVVEQDGSIVSTNYAANCTTVTDEAGKARMSCIDGLGRMTGVWEDPGSSPHLNYETDYTYDAVGNLLCLQQKGGVTGTGCSSPPSADATSPWRVRRFSYDSLSRLLSTKNPESGTINYSYDANGNLLTKIAPRPNQTNTTLTETTNHLYDALNRLTQKTYVGMATAPIITYWYDGVTATGCTPPSIPNAPPYKIGHRTAMCDSSGATSWSYDKMGRVLAEARTIGAKTKSTQYAYNFDGSLQTIRYPSNLTILNYTTSAAGRTIAAQDATFGVNYITNATYTPAGALASYKMGAAINVQMTYNNRLQPLQMFYGTNAPDPPSMVSDACPSTVGNIMHRVYGFGDAGTNDGNVLSILNCRDSNRNPTFTYDVLNRIASAATQGSSCAYCWGQLFGHMASGQYVSGYDAWGNLREITATQGSPTTLNLAVLPYNNRFSGMTYNADGSLKNDGQGNIYTYNHPEGRMTATAGINYTYDGDGMRVKKTGGTLYWRGGGSEVLAESALTGTFTEEYVFFGGKRVARRDVTNGAVHFYLSDHLGSPSAITDNIGTLQKEADYFPFGGEVAVSGTDTNNYKFTGKERDSESGLDMFGARYYGSSLGRFMTPDWAANPQAVPYAVFNDPQSLNLYAYIRNSPLARSDPDGHDPGSGIIVSQLLDPKTGPAYRKGYFETGPKVGLGILGGAIVVASTWELAPVYLRNLLGFGLANAPQIQKGVATLADMAAPPGTPSFSPMGVWVAESVAGRSARALAYEEQITGNVAKAFLVNGVKFDGASAQALLEAKGPGYEQLLRYGLGTKDLLTQARSQLAAAKGVPVTWHVAEEGAANAIRDLFKAEKISGINVVHTSPAK